MKPLIFLKISLAGLQFLRDKETESQIYRQIDIQKNIQTEVRQTEGHIDRRTKEQIDRKTANELADFQEYSGLQVSKPLMNYKNLKNLLEPYIVNGLKHLISIIFFQRLRFFSMGGTWRFIKRRYERRKLSAEHSDQSCQENRHSSLSQNRQGICPT